MWQSYLMRTCARVEAPLSLCPLSTLKGLRLGPAPAPRQHVSRAGIALHHWAIRCELPWGVSCAPSMLTLHGAALWGVPFQHLSPHLSSSLHGPSVQTEQQIHAHRLI
ncbi:hypothetical protein WMY93_026543 [Mugilogobius chulae]|uniref:Uncharacterized protein n=1 Tax=Mugilogobius chulae TaxID=88201 RepID=A0AAW0MXQ3_9GOBI